MNGSPNPPILDAADTDVIFCLDADFRFTSCNAAWDRFAIANGAPELCAPALLGRQIFDYIAEPDRTYYVRVYKLLLSNGQPWEQLYECCSPGAYRLFVMRVLPLVRQAGLMVINSLQTEHVHNRVPCASIEEHYRGVDDLIVMCSGCRRTRRNSARETIWDWVPEFVERMPGKVTHVFCPFCLEHYYAA